MDGDIFLIWGEGQVGVDLRWANLGLAPRAFAVLCENRTFCFDRRSGRDSCLIWIRTNQTRLIPQFASDFLGTAIGRMQIDRVSRQIIGMTNINAEEIRDLLIPIPPLDQQEKLAAEMDVARNERRKNLGKADGLIGEMDDFILYALNLKPPIENKRRVFSITRREVPSRYDPHFHAPEFVQIQRMLASIACEPLSWLARFSNDTWRPAGHDAPTFRYVEISTVNSKTGEAGWSEVATKDAPSRARMRIRSDDLIVSLTRPHHGSIALLDSSFDGAVASTGFAVIREVSDVIRRDYLWCVLRANFCLRQMLQRSSGGNYPAITEHELGNIMVPVPAPDVQERIATEAQRRRRQAAKLRSEADAKWHASKARFEAQLLGPWA